MKKYIAIIISIILAFGGIRAWAEEGYSYGISLCYDGDAYSVDYVFDVPEDVDILSVSIADANCFYDWNYIKSEARLYISLASGNIIPKGKVIATVEISEERTFLVPISIKVNGSTKDKVYAYHTDVPMSYVPPTCEDTGLTWGRYCSNCGIVLDEQEIIPANGHTEVIDKAVEPTCEETGLTEGKHCSVCDKVLIAQDVVDALGHTEVIDKAVVPTCEDTGLTEGKHCSVCDKVLIAQNVVDALGHTEVIDEAVPPTCDKTGLTEGVHCSVCDKILVVRERIPATGHTEVVDKAVAPTCEETGLTEGKHCSVCGKVLVSQGIVSATGHTEVVDEAVEPTCEKTGLTEGSHCSVCDKVLVKQEVVPATGIVVTTFLDEKGTLTVKGALCDKKEADGRVIIAVYDSEKTMLAIADITELDQSNFEKPLEGCKEASYIKILRWHPTKLYPDFDAIIKNVK